MNNLARQPTAARTVASPIGPLQLIAHLNALTEIRFVASQGELAPIDDGDAEREGDTVLGLAERQLAEYFHGQRDRFDLPLHPHGTEFQLQAWSALRTIPFGETRTYGQQAAAIGKPEAVRAVGAANGRNPLPIVVPCHRVIGANGSLTGFAGGLEVKRWLLDHERRIATAATRLF